MRTTLDNTQRRSSVPGMHGADRAEQKLVCPNTRLSTFARDTYVNTAPIHAVTCALNKQTCKHALHTYSCYQTIMDLHAFECTYVHTVHTPRHALLLGHCAYTHVHTHIQQQNRLMLLYASGAKSLPQTASQVRKFCFSNANCVCVFLK